MRLAALLLTALSALAQESAHALLSARCLPCHNAKMQLGKLDLSTRAAALQGGEHGPALLPGNAEASRLHKHIRGAEKPSMPMDGKLSQAEITTLANWIAAGAPYPDSPLVPAMKKQESPEDRTVPEAAKRFWSFQVPRRAQVPAGQHPVDYFLSQTRQAKGLIAAPRASKTTLVRRAYLDLIGLPPTPAQVDAFVGDASPQAWEKLVDQLLASPHYGERWGRHWLDVARYADSSGYEHDLDRPNAWRYRDYVIRAFNEDKPYNTFLEEQLAGDEMEPATQDRLIATAFLRNHAKVDYREKDNPHYRYDYLDDMIATIGRGVLGLTIQCARCHDHKFDPIPQRDYYALQASLWSYVEVNHPLVPPEEAAEFERKNKAIDEKIAPLRAKLKAIEDPFRPALLEKKYRTWPAHIQEAIFTPEDKRSPGQVLLANQIIRTTNVSPAEMDRALPEPQRAERRRLIEQIDGLNKERPAPIAVAMGITDGDYRLSPDGPGDEPAPGKGMQREAIDGTFLNDGTKPYVAPASYFLHHGDIGAPGKPSQPGFPQVLLSKPVPTALPPAHQRTSGRRLALARWLASDENPLTARVAVNRIWHHHFGRGIVASLDNFGRAGDPPTHPELLDWLAVEFREKGWSFKRMHKLLMTSEAYQAASGFAHAGNEARDAANQYLWRYEPQRLEAEILRDSILAVSGSLNTKQFGPAIFPPLPTEVLKSMEKGIYHKQPDGPETWRRGIYVYRKRGLPLPFFEVFDLPDQNITCARRNVSTVAPQALTLMHNDFVIGQAARLADRVASEAGSDPDARIRHAYRLTLGRAPNAEELSASRQFLARQALSGLTHVLLNLNEFVYLR